MNTSFSTLLFTFIKRRVWLAAFALVHSAAFAAQPVITSVTSTLGVVNNAFTYQIEASGTPTLYTATGLPAGLSVNPATGLISGTSSTAGVFAVELSATNPDGTDTAPLTLTLGTVGSFVAFTEPHYLAFDTAGNLAVSSYDTVVTVTPAGTKQILVLDFQEWQGVAFDLAGNLYAGGFLGILKLTPQGVQSTISTAFAGTPQDLVLDPAGNIYLAGSFANLIAKITPAGVVSTFASGAAFNRPTGMTRDQSGNLFVTNYDSGTVTKVTPTGSASIFASGLGNPWDVVVDPAGTLYVSNYLAGTLYKITPKGAVSTLITGLSAFGLTGLALDHTGALFVGDRSQNIFRIGAPLAHPPVITSDREVRAVRDNPFTYQIGAAGSPSLFSAIGLPDGLSLNTRTGLISGTPTESGAFNVSLSATNSAGSGSATLALSVGTLAPFAASPLIVDPTALAFDPDENLVVANFNGEILKITPAGVLSEYAGGLDGATDIADHSKGNLYVSRINGLIHKITPSPLVISVFASGLSEPRTLAFDHSDNLYVGQFDTNPLNPIRGFISKITPTGQVSTFVSGQALSNRITGLAFDQKGNLYASSRAEIGNSAILKITPSGSTSIYAAPVSFPEDLSFDCAGALYVDDNFGGIGRVQRITTTGTVGRFLNYNEAGPIRQFGGLAFDAANDLYVATPNGVSRVSFPEAAPVITSPTAATGTLGQPFSYTITGTDCPTEFAAEVLPPGLVVNATTGVISGTPTQAGCFSVDLAAGNNAGTGFAVLDLRIDPSADHTAPVISKLKVTPATLWPTTHKLVSVKVSAKVTDNAGVTSFKITKVTSSEPDKNLGGGDVPNDIQITGDLTVNLRAERSPRGQGRTYTLTVEARDAAGNKTTKTVTVFVPKNQGRSY